MAGTGKSCGYRPPATDLTRFAKEYSDMLLSKAGLCKTERRFVPDLLLWKQTMFVRRLPGWNRLKRTYLSGSKGLEPEAHGMDGYERLLLLHQCLHLDEPQNSAFNWDSLTGTGLSAKDYIAPSSFQFKGGRYFRVGPSVGAVSFCRSGPPRFYDTLLNALLNIESSQIVSIHAKALDQGPR